MIGRNSRSKIVSLNVLTVPPDDHLPVGPHEVISIGVTHTNSPIVGSSSAADEAWPRCAAHAASSLGEGQQHSRPKYSLSPLLLVMSFAPFNVVSQTKAGESHVRLRKIEVQDRL
jgi:hypothetical protein